MLTKLFIKMQIVFLINVLIAQHNEYINFIHYYCFMVVRYPFIFVVTFRYIDRKGKTIGYTEMMEMRCQ